MQCSEETLVRLFYNASSSFLLLFLFFFFTSILLAKIFTFLGGNLFFWRNPDGYEFAGFSDEEEEEEKEEEENDQYGHRRSSGEKDEIINPTEFLRSRSTRKDQNFPTVEVTNSHEPSCKETEEHGPGSDDNEQQSIYSSVVSESRYNSGDEVGEEDANIPNIGDTYSSLPDSQTNGNGPTSNDEQMDFKIRSDKPIENDPINPEGRYLKEIAKDQKRVEISSSNLMHDENYLVFQPAKLEEGKKLLHQLDVHGREEEIFGETYTVGSTSKDSSEWRSSINCSGTEDPFSSSSRRSCPKWESYTVFQKYDEEMLFLDRISAQKLHETESLRSIQSCPRSISERISHKLATMNKKSDFRHNPYHELEAAYVAQICLTWEALNWNYKYFQRLRASRPGDTDPGCPAYVAQQFQQFQVLLQRYIENEPYEHGRRPEIYARMRRLAPKLLQVPEYRDSDEEKREDAFCSRISSVSFILIMEEAIRTFMNFLKADRESNCCQILAAFFRRNRRGPADPTLYLLLKKVNKKKKMRVKDLRRSRKCLRKRRLNEEEEMEILMAEIDLKVVSRVLRMMELNEEQLHWCEDKMSKVRVSDRKLHRDSSPLFFPAH